MLGRPRRVRLPAARSTRDRRRFSERCFAATTASAAAISRSIILREAFDFDPDVLDARFASTHRRSRRRPPSARWPTPASIAGDIDAVIISTCTGYLCPGLTSYVTERLGLPTDILALDLVGQGCGAALPNMRTAKRCSRAAAPAGCCRSASRSAARRCIWTTIRAC